MIEKKYKISWNDIDILYQELNNQRSRFNMAQVIYNNNSDNKIITNHIKELNDEVEAMSVNKYITDKAYTNIVIPNKKTKITTLEFKTISDKINYIGTICPDCDCDGYCPNCGCDGYCDSDGDCPDCDSDGDCPDCDCQGYCSFEDCACQGKCDHCDQCDQCGQCSQCDQCDDCNEAIGCPAESCPYCDQCDDCNEAIG